MSKAFYLVNGGGVQEAILTIAKSSMFNQHAGDSIVILHHNEKAPQYDAPFVFAQQVTLWFPKEYETVAVVIPNHPDDVELFAKVCIRAGSTERLGGGVALFRVEEGTLVRVNWNKLN
jgi:hypothetical protein